jgi:hypothetical protein
VDAPIMPKITSTPSFTRLSHNICAPVIFMVISFSFRVEPNTLASRDLWYHVSPFH